VRREILVSHDSYIDLYCVPTYNAFSSQVHLSLGMCAKHFIIHVNEDSFLSLFQMGEIISYTFCAFVYNCDVGTCI